MSKENRDKDEKNIQKWDENRNMKKKHPEISPWILRTSLRDRYADTADLKTKEKYIEEVLN